MEECRRAALRNESSSERRDLCWNALEGRGSCGRKAVVILGWRRSAAVRLFGVSDEGGQGTGGVTAEPLSPAYLFRL